MRPPNVPEKSFSTRPSPDTRRSSPTPRTPARSSSSPIPRSAITAPAWKTTKPPSPTSKAWSSANFRSVARLATRMPGGRVPRERPHPHRFTASIPAPSCAICARAASCAACSRRSRTNPAGTGGHSAPHPHHERSRSRQPRLHARSLSVDEPVEACSPTESSAAPARADVPHGGLRFRYQAQHPPPAGAAGCRVTVVPAARPGRRHARATSPTACSLERPGRSRAGLNAGENIRNLIGKKPDLRHLPRPPAARPGARRQDLQAQVRPSRRQPPGATKLTQDGRDHRAESRLRGRSRSLNANDVELTHINLNDQTLEGFRHPQRAGLLRAVPPRGRAGPARLALPVQGFRQDDGGRRS